ncbi:MAG: hypothetical protein HGJ94_14050 [Desulfosarcina sp.]|nr:hypothetical protein [Desulfosarcina sp.]MBC2741546.1 hypothetical protein [Desulfosarcina sp.]MBC2764460.1 hypothetical protein [Desulfosarcina sp.]
MQDLYVKVKDPETGQTSQKKVTVIRSWSDVSGAHVYLHANGVYGYKDASPIRTEADLTVITNPRQNQQAKKWWRMVGQEMSRKYYDDQNRVLDELNARGVPDLDAGALDLDAVLYSRRPIKDRRAAAYSDPTLWPVWFTLGRPEWWGHAGVIEIGGFRYQVVEVDDLDGDPESVEPVDQDDGDEESKSDEIGVTAPAGPGPPEKETGPTFNPDPGE